MRTRSIYPLLFSGLLLLLLTTLLLTWGSPPVGSWAAGATWTDLQGPKGGPAQALALNPDYPSDQTMLGGGGHDLFYASWKGAGFFRSLDSGATWGAPNGPADGAAFDAAFSPRWRDDGFAAAGLWQGLWLTHDRGATWQQVSGMEIGTPGSVHAVAIGSSAPGEYTLLAGGPWGGFYRSVDQGITWSTLFDPGGVARILFDPFVPTMAWAATGTGLLRSTDSGLKWTRVTTATAASDVALGPNGRVFTIFDDHAWYSATGGGTWHVINSPEGQRLSTIGASADQLGLYMAAGPNLYRYDVGANSLLTVTTDLPHGNITRLVLSPHFGEDKTLWVGDYNGVWISRDAGATFTRSSGFAPVTIYRVRAAEGNHDGDLFVAGDEGVWRLRSGNWQPLNDGMVGDAATVNTDLAVSPAFAQDHTLFSIHALANALGSTLFRSRDGGATWDRPIAGLEYMNQVAISPDFIQDRRVYLVAVKQIWGSLDGGDTWAREPFWDATHAVRMMALSPAFAQDQTMVAAGDKLYRSTDAGVSWEVIDSPPVLGAPDGSGWGPGRLTWAKSGRLYLSIAHAEDVAPYMRHDQIWTSTDTGQTWTQLPSAPDVPIWDMTTGPSSAGSSAVGGEALYLSTYDSQELDEREISPDLYVSRDHGVTWLNLGATPNGAARLEAPTDVPDMVWAGNQGVWQLAAQQAPTATPNPMQELLSNRSFEYTGVWRIPDTAYAAAYSQDQHFTGYWSMRTGITDPAANVHAYSDFSQDVTLPMTGTATLLLHRWPQAGALAPSSVAAPAPDAATLEEFYRALEAARGDLQYGLVIEQPGNQIHYLYAGLDNPQAWEEKTFDLSGYQGKSVRLQFGTYNDGSGPTAVQYFDALSLQVVGPTQPTPGATPTATATLPPRSWLPYVETGRTP